MITFSKKKEKYIFQKPENSERKTEFFWKMETVFEKRNIFRKTQNIISGIRTSIFQEMVIPNLE